MNSTLHRIFGQGIKVIIRTHRHAWWELKKEYDNGGYSHTAFGHFNNLANYLVLSRLKDHKEELGHVYVKLTGKQAKDEEMTTYLSNIVIEEICRRAEVAARKTRNW